ncbi:MAG: TIM barrel protein [Chloroflexi bacterium]|nr:TIM barrel protein [Chloroflexota bacterium]MCY4246035.1 TIM barrel protein [Chloroflexota bacterium]
MTDWRKRIAIISDEAADSFAEAVGFCLPLGIRAYELRKLEGGRFPHVTESAIEEVAETVSRHELELIGVSPGFFKGPLDAEVIARTFDHDLPLAFRLMERLGLRQMTLFTFRRGNRDEAIPDEIYEHLGRAVELCAREGIEVLLENASSIYSDTGANLATIARALGLGIVWDPCNAAQSGELAFPDGYRQVREALAAVHFKNWSQEQGVVAINAGIVDMAAQVRALQADGYAGYYTLEPHQWHDRKNAVRNNHEQLLALLEG